MRRIHTLSLTLTSVLLAGGVTLPAHASSAAPGRPTTPPAAPGAPTAPTGPEAPTGSGKHVATPGKGLSIAGRWIVTVRPGVSPQGIARAASVSPRFVYSAALNGFAAELTDGQLRAVRAHRDTVSVEPDQVVAADGTQTVGGGLYGLDRVDQAKLPLSGSYAFTSTGAGVTAYVIDSGIDAAHADFGGRAKVAYDALGGTGADCNGHGTHVAGTVGGGTYGVAKGVQLRGVRVLDCTGSGSLSAVIAGIDWVRANAARPAVANLSLGAGYSSALNSATEALIASGVPTAVAAGNSGTDACKASPASTAPALTVAASDAADNRASFSNAGACVDVYAPGVSVTSAWPGGGAASASGTSMASPHVAGVAALYAATYPTATPAAIHDWVVKNATPSVIKGNPTGTPNRLLHKRAL